VSIQELLFSVLDPIWDARRGRPLKSHVIGYGARLLHQKAMISISTHAKRRNTRRLSLPLAFKRILRVSREPPSEVPREVPVSAGSASGALPEGPGRAGPGTSMIRSLGDGLIRDVNAKTPVVGCVYVILEIDWVILEGQFRETLRF
jgi:hypothetical protein